MLSGSIGGSNETSGSANTDHFFQRQKLNLKLAEHRLISTDGSASAGARA